MAKKKELTNAIEATENKESEVLEETPTQWDFFDKEQAELLYRDDPDNKENFKVTKYTFTKNYYFETHTADGHKRENAPTEEEWKQQVINLIKYYDNAEIKEAWFIFHDKCHKPTGERKELHVHGYIDFKNKVFRNSVIKQLDMLAYGVDKVGKMSLNIKYYIGRAKYLDRWMRYLTHISETAISEYKRIYPVEELHYYKQVETEDKDGKKISKLVEVTDYEEKLTAYQRLIAKKKHSKKKETQEKYEELFDDALLEIVRFKLMNLADVVKYMREHKPSEFTNDDITVYVSKKRRDIDNALLTAAEDRTRTVEESGRGSQNVFISGLANAGKSRLMKELTREILRQKNISQSSVHKISVKRKGSLGHDMGDGYTGQHIIQADELEASSVGFTEFNSIFDEHATPKVSSRFRDKIFINDFAFITKADTFNQWTTTVATDSDRWENIYDNDTEMEVVRKKAVNANQLRQVRRRFSYYIQAEEDKITLYQRVKTKKKDLDGGTLYIFKDIKTYKVPHLWADSSQLSKTMINVIEKIAKQLIKTER